MSKENALKFLAYTEANPDVQAAISRLRGENTLDELVAIARQHGFDFSKAEYRDAVVAMSEGALSEEAIEDTARSLGLELKKWGLPTGGVT